MPSSVCSLFSSSRGSSSAAELIDRCQILEPTKKSSQAFRESTRLDPEPTRAVRARDSRARWDSSRSQSQVRRAPQDAPGGNRRSSITCLVCATVATTESRAAQSTQCHGTTVSESEGKGGRTSPRGGRGLHQEPRGEPTTLLGHFVHLFLIRGTFTNFRICRVVVTMREKSCQWESAPGHRDFPRCCFPRTDEPGIPRFTFAGTSATEDSRITVKHG